MRPLEGAAAAATDPAARAEAPFLRLQELSKSFAARPVLSRLNLDVRRGEIVALLGPSGSGKTTALRLVAGFERPDSGSVHLAGEDVTRRPPERRGCGMVFQSYALFPHLSVGENVAFGLLSAPRATRLRGDAVRSRVAEVLALVHLDGLEERRIAELSGGMQQRVALARALAPRPRVLLLDEPLSNLDPALRERTRRELRAAIDEVGITTVLVTHEQEEAFDLADRVAVLHAGRLEQVGHPEELYDNPQTPFVAAFIGRSSALPGRVVAAAGAAGQIELELENRPVWPVRLAEPLPSGAAVDVWVRPAGLVLLAATGATPPALNGRVLSRRFGRPLGSFRVALAALGAGEPAVEIEVAAPPETASVGESVAVAPREGMLAWAFGRRSP